MKGLHLKVLEKDLSTRNPTVRSLGTMRRAFRT